MVDQVRVITGLLARATERVVKAISVNVTAELIETTPVDTGWARSNWVPAIGAPLLDPATDQADPALVPAQEGRQAAGVATVATGYRLSLGSVFISNNVPYIIDLNDGSSQQAPAAFVQSSIAVALSKLGDRIPG